MKLIDFKSLNLTIEESRDLIKCLAQRRGVSIKKLLSTIKPSLRRKNNKDLTTKSQRELRKTQHGLIKSIKSQQEPIIPQQTLPNIKERIEVIRKELNELRNNFSRSELKEIRNHLYNIENKNELVKSKEYLDELDKKIIELNELDYDFIENLRDLFNTLNYVPILVKAGYDNNYLEYRSEGNNSLSFEEYLDLIKPHLNDKGEWKRQLTAQINFISLRPGSDETRVIHTRSVNEKFMNRSNMDEVIKALFKSILQKYQENLQEKMKGPDFAFDGINYLYYDLNKITISKGGSYIDSPKWLKNKNSTINPKNNDYKCFQYAITLALNYDKIDRNPKRISKIKPFIENYNWKDIDFPSTRKDWNKFELNNNNIALNILYVPFNTKKIESAYNSKHNLTRDNQIILLMISNGENWHYLAVKVYQGYLQELHPTIKKIIIA